MEVEVLIKNSDGVFGGRKEKKARKGKWYKWFPFSRFPFFPPPKDFAGNF